MARINFEDDVEAREEFRKLTKLLGGDDDRARGMLIRFWRIAQKHWAENRLVPECEMELGEFKPLIDSRWAFYYQNGYIDTDGQGTETGGYYAIGSEERFAWYRQKIEAGKKGGRPEDEKKRLARQAVNRALDNGTLARGTSCEDCGSTTKKLEGHHDDYDRPLSVRWLCRDCHRKFHKAADDAENRAESADNRGSFADNRAESAGSRRPSAANPLTLTPSPVPVPSLFPVLTQNEEERKFPTAPAKKRERPATDTGPTWEAYAEAYSRRYRVAPTRNATVNGQLANFVKRLGAEEAPQVAAFFLTHNGSYYVQTMHPVGVMLRDAEKLRTEWATGTKMLASKAKEIERTQHNLDAWDFAAAALEARKGQTHES